MRTMSSLVVILLAGSTLPAAEPSFAVKPTATKAGDKVTIAFALAAPTDVEVAIVDKDGKVVRHLAAGVLGGGGPPPPPLKPGLAQELGWDGKDDLGKAVFPSPSMGDPQGTGRDEGGRMGTGTDFGKSAEIGASPRSPADSGKTGTGTISEKSVGNGASPRFPFTVRVRAGMGAKFGRLIGASPYTGSAGLTPYRAPQNGLVAGPDGALYVLMMSDIHSHGNSGLWPWHLRKFDKTGQYQKTLLPYPPSPDPAKAGGMTLLATADGAFTPAQQNSLYPVVYVFGDEIMPRMVDGQVVFINSRARVLNFFKPDGSNALKTVPMWSPKAKLQCGYFLSIQAAVSPDGKYVYYSNVAAAPYEALKPSDIPETWPNGRVYRQDLSQPGSDPVKFFDLTPPEKHTWLPNAWNKKTAAAGIDVDAKGNVLVCDLATQALIEVGPDGKQLSVTKVPWPDKVVASRKSGTLYVLSKKFEDKNGGAGPPSLVKLTGRGPDAKLLNLPLRGVAGGSITLDETGDVPVLWIGGGGSLIRVEDRGGDLVPTAEKVLNRDANAIGFIGYMDVDREADLVYVTGSGSAVWRYSGATGEGGPIKLKAVDLAVGRDGTVYTWGVAGGYAGPIGRFTRDLNPLPLASGSHTYGGLSGRAGRGSSVCGMDVDAQGRVFVTDGSNHCHVRAYDASGALVQFPTKIKLGKDEVPVLIDQVSGYGGSLRVDLAGNVYVLQPGVPKGWKPPKGYEKDEACLATAATILKFGPQGGKRNTPLDEGGRGGDMLGFSGILATYPDCSPVSGWRCDGACACVHLRFDVDDFGRLYVPNVITYSVSVRDNAGNEIARFGRYGNFDCQGPQSAEPKPEIPLGWPIAVGASDRFIYVGDCLNHRVVRVDTTWATEATCEVK